MYQLEMVPDTIRVQMTYIPQEKDSSVLEYGSPFFGSMKDQMRSVIHLQMKQAYRIDSMAAQVIVYHDDAMPLEISYELIDTHLPRHRVVGEMFRLLINETYFFSLTNTLFLHPMVPDSVQDQHLMEVKAIPHPLYPFYYSFAPELRPGEDAVVSWKKGLNALVMGASDLRLEKRMDGGISNYVVLRIQEKNSYNLDRFMTYTDAFLPAMTDFWGELNGDHYSLIAAPFVDIDYHKISGTAFQDGFHVKYSGDTVLVDEEVVSTISHEIMHRYIGAGSVSMGEQHQWFDEGFTDFTTWYVLMKCGLISESQFYQKIRVTYEELQANPQNQLPNSEVMKHFWEGKDFENLPYQRGALFAAYLQQQLSVPEVSEDRYRQLMRDLKAISQEKGSLEPTDLLKGVKRYLPDAPVEEWLDLYIMKGRMLPEDYL